MATEENPKPGPIVGFVLRVSLAVHAVAAGGYWVLQPRGFPVVSLSFVEHQILAPAVLAVSLASLAAVLANRWRVVWIGTAVLAGFWATHGAVIGIFGSTLPAKLSWGFLAGAVAVLVLAYRRPAPTALITGGTVAGVGLASLFWYCTWAPPATTRSAGTPPAGLSISPAPPVLEADGIRVSVSGRRVGIQAGPEQTWLWPGFEYDAVADSGLWTLFDFRSTYLPSWNCGRSEEGGLFLSSENEDFMCHARVWVQNRVVHVRCTTQVKRELAAHLASVMQLQLPGDASVEGIPWQGGNTSEQSDFIAFRNGRTEFLRATSDEKGPFETRGSWEPRDPVLTIGGWKVQVVGWAQQGSMEISPTAGWGVSQAAIERARSTYFWSLASTSIGRGWNTVRTAAGVYVLEAVITPP